MSRSEHYPPYLNTLHRYFREHPVVVPRLEFVNVVGIPWLKVQRKEGMRTTHIPEVVVG